MDNIFYKIDAKDKDKILRILEAQMLKFKKNVSILKSINSYDTVAIVISGSIKIIRTDYNGNETLSEEFNENAIFSYALSSINSNEYDIITKEDTIIVTFDYSKIINTEDNHYYFKQFIKNFIQIITYKINEKNEKIEILTKKSIRDKLLEYFRIVSKKNGSRIIYLSLSFTELADYLAIDRCAMSRELKNLENEGFIKKDNKKITLLY